MFKQLHTCTVVILCRFCNAQGNRKGPWQLPTSESIFLLLECNKINLTNLSLRVRIPTQKLYCCDLLDNPCTTTQIFVTQSMKRYQVLVHSFVRNQLERRSGSIFPKFFLFVHRNDTSL